MKKKYFSIFLTLLFFEIHAQSDMIHQLYQQHDTYKERSIQNRRFKHKDIVPIIKQLNDHNIFATSVLGKSFEGRDIYLVKLGRGKTKVLLWSQMHGDEPTATMAMLDIFNFFKNENDDYRRFKNKILNELTLYFVPMLNPDGAERYQRRNAQDIDLNRDALRTQTPEGKILKDIRDETEAQIGFNLHDQSRYYSAGISPNPATISFLAPAYNYEKEINPTRQRAMELIISMNKVIQTFLPNHVAKYSDDFEPRAFGDNIQKWGTSTILTEAGGLRGDPEKQKNRQLHFVMLLAGFDAIANNTYQDLPIKEYYAIPDNERRFVDLIIRNVSAPKNGKYYKTDIAFKRNEIENEAATDFHYESYINDLGDLSIYYGYEELNAEGYNAKPGKVYPDVIKSSTELEQIDLMQWIKEGYTDVLVEKVDNPAHLTQLPVKVHTTKKTVSNRMALNSNPNLILTKDGNVDFAIVNGQLYKLK